jgi:hypothetical protein
MAFPLKKEGLTNPFSQRRNEMDLRDLTQMMAPVAIACVIALPAAADEDVYNFYFQKGGAPQQVIQGGAGQSARTPIDDLDSKSIRKGARSPAEESGGAVLGSAGMVDHSMTSDRDYKSEMRFKCR